MGVDVFLNKQIQSANDKTKVWLVALEAQPQNGALDRLAMSIRVDCWFWSI
jgi:hypothetical protein